MKNNWITRTIYSLLFLSLFAAVNVLPVSASYKGRNSSKPALIVLASIGEQKLGMSFDLFGTIKDDTGKPLPNEHIIFTIGKDYLGQSKSDTYGNFVLKVNRDLEAGTYVITATFKGSHIYKQAIASTLMQINPATVLVQTVPAISGVSFRMDGQKMVSDINGSVKFNISRVGNYLLEVLVKDYSNPSKRIEFGRWEDENYLSYKKIKVPTNNPIQVGLNVFEQVNQKFVDLSGLPVPQQRVTEYTIKSAQGDLFTFTDNLPHWIPSSRIARRITGLEETKLQYSMVKVVVDGSNVVNQAQQRYYASPNGSWETSLLLYSIKIHTRDGLFDSPVGKSINLIFPNGKVYNYPLDLAGNAQIHSLARGLYTINMKNVSGISSKTPVALSRDQEVQVKVITYIDIGIIGLLGLVLGFGLFFLGRPWLIRPIFKKIRKFKLDARSYSYHEN